jgi:N-carbamoylputrescine amidase
MVRCGLIQARNVLVAEHSLGEIREAMVRKHVEMIEQAAREKVQILCLQELFYGPYFCAEQDPRWYGLAEAVPDGPSVRLMQELAAKHHMVIIVPVYEQELPGLYFNTAAVIRRGRTLPGKISQTSHSALPSGFLGEILFHARRSGLPGVLPQNTRRWACTSAMTGTFPKARARWD